MLVTDFYGGCEIFITGGSGAVGKALIEKLLRSCNVKKVYLLLRPKKDMNADQRLQKLCKAKIFRRLRNSQPEELNKLVAIPGDASLPNLAISAKDAKMMENVSVVFHCAATVRFDEPLKVAIKLNVGGTLAALNFSETLKNLKIFVHVSTFFSNPYLEYVSEEIYDSPMDWKFCLNSLNKGCDDQTLDILTKKMITGFPNTYTFTKNLSESLVNEYRGRVPVTIYRPSIILFAIKEPEPGFPPSMFGAMGLFVLAGAGLLKCILNDATTRLDITPQDLGINSMLYYGAKAGKEYKKGIPDQLPVYIFSSYEKLPFPFQQLAMIADDMTYFLEYPFEKCFLIPGCCCTSNGFVYMFNVFLKQVLPAVFGDLLLMAFGRKPVIMSIARKSFVTLEAMRPFLFNDYKSAGISLVDEMIEEYKGTDFDIEKEVNCAETKNGIKYLASLMFPKMREILLNEDESTIERSRRILKAKIYAYNIIRLILGYYFLRWFYGKLLHYFRG